ncbi:hypothetical protein A3H26_00020 [candidate division WWE3 bacterium RIFCSPLOWO2_12_FULL_36_10]|uniref:Uncharacterized protein n=1 Tax=candidate division WWE3 bacterium RIFCSPLOWO2_12_FULL_36_10 TaxID=1802630 RepID=A0A1F4VK48_UNCKA|nr:MAG: hypothetical protein A3H26_00020 [candidate division WWE3 bacterium RIFCSPLOWO2_12_FULL_36_10]
MNAVAPGPAPVSNVALPLPEAPRPQRLLPADDQPEANDTNVRIVSRRQGGGSFWKVLFQILIFVGVPMVLIAGAVHSLPVFAMNIVGGLLVYVGNGALALMGGEHYFQSQLGSVLLLVLIAGIVLGFMFSRGRRQ